MKKIILGSILLSGFPILFLYFSSIIINQLTVVGERTYNSNGLIAFTAFVYIITAAFITLISSSKSFNNTNNTKKYSFKIFLINSCILMAFILFSTGIVIPSFFSLEIIKVTNLYYIYVICYIVLMIKQLYRRGING
jgi:hypothetical protein